MFCSAIIVRLSACALDQPGHQWRPTAGWARPVAWGSCWMWLTKRCHCRRLVPSAYRKTPHQTLGVHRPTQGKIPRHRPALPLRTTDRRVGNNRHGTDLDEVCDRRKRAGTAPGVPPQRRERRWAPVHHHIGLPVRANHTPPTQREWHRLELERHSPD